MDEKKPPAKGIKLNVSQLPLSNKADFVLGADSRKVLDNKIIENLGGSGSHGYFPSTVSRGYKSWSVSRELEIPSQADLAEEQMRMIEGASASAPLQNEASGTTSSDSDPFFMRGAEEDSNPFAHEPQHAETLLTSPDASYVQSSANPFDSPPSNPLNTSKPNPLDANQSNPFDVHKPNPLDAQVVSSEPGNAVAEPNFGAGSSFAHEFGDRTTPANSTPAANPALADQQRDTIREVLPRRAPSLTPAADPDLAAKLVETMKENVPQKLPAQPIQQVDADAPSPWSGPVADAQPPVVVRQNLSQPESQQWAESPWAAPVMDKQPPMAVSANMSPHTTPQMPLDTQPQARPEMTPETSAESDDGWVFVGAEASSDVPPSDHYTPPAEHYTPSVEQPPADPYTPPAVQYTPPVDNSTPAAQPPVPNRAASSSASDADLIPSWMSALESESTAGGDSSESTDDSINVTAKPAEVEVELETFLNSIPDEEFIIDNETMRHLFSSLCEPKTPTLKIKSAASDAADLAIAAAAAEILNSEVSIDEISIDDIATAEILAAEQSPEADFEAIQQAYAMLDLSPLPAAQRKEGFHNVFDVVEKAAEEQSNKVEQEVAADSSVNVARTERGTIEMAIHAGGRQLVPQYNFCGMLTSVEMSDGLSFILSEEKNTWQMIEQSGKVMVSGIKSVSFDRQGNLSYVTKRGDTVTLKVDGTIDTKFAKKSAPGASENTAGVAEAPVGVPETVSEVSQEVVGKGAEEVVNNAPEELVDKVPQELAKEEEKAAPAKATKPSKSTKKESKSSAKPTEKPGAKSSEKSGSKSSEKPGAKPSTKPQAKETKPSTKGSSKPKKKGR
ncbi:MAG: hypothetical protein JST89_10755 [Cyanobacteria bacterium SZAS-4]|nr:hypothetical protein [Cyanobacteria bacterium SZAS-4]